MTVPPRRLEPGPLVLATHNPGKLREIAELVEPHALDLRAAGDLGLPEPEETGATFLANAELKARAAAEGSGLPALADDSGLAVPALDGAPGIYSARWAGPGKDFSVAMERVHDELRDCGVRLADPGADPGLADLGPAAYFVCVLCLAWPDGETLAFEGRVEGTLVWPPRGGRGFGYDPLFLPEGASETFGEIEPAAKHRMSHRARAFEKLLAVLPPATP